MGPDDSCQGDQQALMTKDIFLEFPVVGETGEDSGEDPRGERKHRPPRERNKLLQPRDSRELDHIIWNKSFGNENTTYDYLSTI